jgi:uncharacterized membrane protein HdeD (DUF308 family)
MGPLMTELTGAAMTNQALLDYLHGNWGWVALRGFAAVVFAVLAFAWPGLTLVVLTLFWGAYALIDGVLALIAAFRVRDRGKPMWMLVLVGVLGVGAGVATFAWPGMTAVLLLTFIAAWAIAIGIAQIVVALRIRKEIDNEWYLIGSGALSILFGVLMALSPGAGAVAVVWFVAAYAGVFGLLLMSFGFRLRRLATNKPAAGNAE